MAMDAETPVLYYGVAQQMHVTDLLHTLLHIAEEIQISSWGRVIRGENVASEDGVGCFGVVDAVPAHMSLSRVASGGTTIAARHVRVEVVWWPAAPAAHHRRILETFIFKDRIC